jgi:tripartite-type tricarboxylate transporter receptor subunit TctC
LRWHGLMGNLAADRLGMEGIMKRALALGVGLFLLAAAFPAQAQYPDRMVRIVVPVAAGGGVDVVARILGQKLSERLGQQFVVENRPGAAGAIGTKEVARSPADGYTLLYTPSSLVITTIVNKNAGYDSLKDLSPIVNVAISPYALLLHPSVPAKTVKEFIAYAKANPDKINYSSAGVGSASHLAAELFQNMAGVKMQHIPNKGMNPALMDLLGGNTQVLVGSVPTAASDEKAGRVRAVAVAEKRRSTLMPQLPTIDESGLAGFEVANWHGLLGPAGMDPRVVKKLHDEIIAILDTADMKQRFETLGFDRVGQSPQEFSAQLKSDLERWGDVVRRANVPVN